MTGSRWWIVLGAVMGLLVGNGPIMQFAYAVFLKPLTEAFGTTRATMSSAILFGFIATAIATPVLGRLIDRHGIRKVALPVMILFAISVALLGVLPTSAPAFIALYCVAGLLAAAQTPLPYAKAVASAFDDRRGLALGIAMAGVGLGTAIVPKLAQVLIDRFDWRGAYIGLGLLILLLALPALGLLVREPAPRGTASSAGSPAATAEPAPGLTGAEAIATWSFWAMFLAFFALAAATSGVLAHIVAILTDRGVEANLAASTLAAAGIALILGRLLVGWMLDHVHAPWVAVAFILTTLAGLAVLLRATSPAEATVAAILIGIGLGAEVDLIAFMISRYLGMRAFGEIYGYQFGGFLLASGVGPFLMGVSHTVTGAYTTALLGFGGGLLLAAVLVLTLGRYAYVARPAPVPVTAT